MGNLTPNYKKKIYQEFDITPSAGLKPNDAYDLALYEEAGSSRGVLVVTVVLQFQFKEGTGTTDPMKGRPLIWTEGEKKRFASEFKDACYNVWNDKFRITTPSLDVAIKNVGVQFNIKTIIDSWDTSDHWELTVQKVDGWSGSSVTIFTGNSTIDSLDVALARKPHGSQRGAVHEFGHMLGYQDEYQADDGSIPGTAHWVADHDSVMNNGETLRHRHYSLYAAWLTEQYADLAHLAGNPIIWKVNGTWDVANSHL